jgi:hypothetical protein
MARKGLPPGFLKRGGKGKGPMPPAPKGKNGKKAVVAKGAPLASPPPRQRVTPGMQPPVQVPIQRAPAALIIRGGPPPDEGAEGGGMPPEMGPAMAAGVGGSPMRRRVAQAMRGGRMAF